MSELNWSGKGLKDSDLLKKPYDEKNDIKCKKLDLCLNKVTSLPDLRTFRQFDNLKVLNLFNNNLRDFDFSLIPPTVKELDLNENKLASAGNLSQCTELEYLDVSSNHITLVDWRNLPPALTWLDLGGNQLNTVGDVTQCTRLLGLWMQNNHINQIEWKNLPPALTMVDLSKNQLTTVDLCHCTQVGWLYLHDIPTLETIKSLPNKHFDLFINSTVKVLGRKCFHEKNYTEKPIKTTD